MSHNNENLRELESDGIRSFVESCADLLTGRVLDFGSGKQPYRSLVQGEYVPYDRIDNPGSCATTDVGPDFPLSELWDAILCTQVLQYLPNVQATLGTMRWALKPGGHLIMTSALTWPEIEPEDEVRYTRAGLRRRLEEAGFEIVRCEPRGEIDLGGFRLTLGYGWVVRAS